MIYHYLSTALASFRKAPLITTAKTLSLVTGLACFVGAASIVSYWRDGDSHHRDAHRIVAITQTASNVNENAAARFNAASSATLARYLKSDIPALERVARAFQEPQVAVATPDSKIVIDAAVVDPDFAEIFDLHFVAGERRTALTHAGGVVLTQDAAVRLFGATPALGKTLLIDNERVATVTGVIAPVRQPSFMGPHADATLTFEMLSNWASSPGARARDAQETWVRSTALTFAVVRHSVALANLNERLAWLVAARVPSDVRARMDVRLEAVPLGELKLRQLNSVLLGRSGADLSIIAVVIGLAVLTLFAAAVNFANLSTAEAATRGKEIGLRRALGARRLQLMAQCWTEALLLTSVALILALVVLALARPAVMSALHVDILYGLSSGGGLELVGLVLVLAAVCGFYPAIVLSGTRPADAIKSRRPRGGGGGLVGRLLIGVQFGSASLLLIPLIVTQLQERELERVAFPVDKDPTVVLNNVSRLEVDYDTLKARLEERPGIISVTIVDRAPWGSGRVVVEVARSQDPAAFAPPGYLKVLRHDYFKTLGIEVLAGRAFSIESEPAPIPMASGDAARPAPVVVDRAYASRLGFDSPAAAIGEFIYLPASNGGASQPMRIIGVTETENSRLEAAEVSGHIYVLTPWRPASAQYPMVRIARNDITSSIAAIREVWNELVPNIPASIRFTDELFAASFTAHARVAQLLSVLSLAAFAIALFGLVGMAVHIAARRRHEIAVRKTIGSSVWRAVSLLLVDFAKPVVVANLVAWPLGYFAAQAYLSAFAHRIELTPWPFLLSLIITATIGWIAVGTHTFKTARVRPVEVLRYE